MEQGKEQRLLDHINFPSDLRKLREDQLLQVCDELRQFIIDECSSNPGHLGASLGVIELTVALHYVYNTPHDAIIWDVGPGYSHKILTGRKDAFFQPAVQRHSGFPKMSRANTMPVRDILRPPYPRRLV
jgi:1-deoxy-D-xylulose-5-phosphate synthase